MFFHHQSGDLTDRRVRGNGDYIFDHGLGHSGSGKLLKFVIQLF